MLNFYRDSGYYSILIGILVIWKVCIGTLEIFPYFYVLWFSSAHRLNSDQLPDVSVDYDWHAHPEVRLAWVVAEEILQVLAHDRERNHVANYLANRGRIRGFSYMSWLSVMARDSNFFFKYVFISTFFSAKIIKIYLWLKKIIRHSKIYFYTSFRKKI